MASLLSELYIGGRHHGRIVLEIVIDVLCVYAGREVRAEGFRVLGAVLGFVEVGRMEGVLLEGLGRLDGDRDDGNVRELVLRMVAGVMSGVSSEGTDRLIVIVRGFMGRLTDQKLLAENLGQFVEIIPHMPEE